MLYMLPTSSSMLGLPTWYGCITAPERWGRRPIEEGRPWCCDNGAYSGRFDPDKFLKTLESLEPHAATCRFIVAPDVIQDAHGTLELWREWAPIIRSFAYPVALVAHNGMTPDDLPADADALFIGGSDEWRDAPSTHELIAAAKARGMWIHVGRVNSNKRIRHWRTLGADSSDGTHSAFAGLQNTVRLFNQSLAEQPLFPTTFDTLDARRPS